MPRKVSARLGRSRTTTLLSWLHQRRSRPAPAGLVVLTSRVPTAASARRGPAGFPHLHVARARSAPPEREAAAPSAAGPRRPPVSGRGRGERAPRGRRVLTVPARSPCRGGAVHAAAQPFHAPRRQPHAPGLAAPRATTLPSAGRAAINPAPHAATPSPCKIPDTSSTTASQHSLARRRIHSSHQPQY